MLCLAVCTFAAVCDIRTRRIPNRLSYAALALGITAAAIDPSIGLGRSLLGVVTAGGLFLLFWAFRAVGAGDAKLMAAVGAFIGFPAVFDVVFLSALAGGLLGLLWLVWRPAKTGTDIAEDCQQNDPQQVTAAPSLRQRMKTERIPYAVAILIGMAIWSFFTFSGRA